MPLTETQRVEWGAHLHDALEAVETAIKRLDADDTDEANAAIMDGTLALKRVGDAIDRYDQENDPEFQKAYSAEWFRSALVVSAVVDALPRETLFEEGAYKWRVRDQGTVKPPLQMPPEYELHKDGPVATVTVGCNSMSVSVTITAE
jgi:hypothetical protein